MMATVIMYVLYLNDFKFTSFVCKLSVFSDIKHCARSHQWHFEEKILSKG